MKALLANKAYPFRLYPTKEQERQIAKTIGCSRFIFNHFLAKWNDTYKETGKGLTYRACSAQLPQLKQELSWLKEVDSIAIQSSLKNLADSFSRFFKKQNGKPRFKSKKTMFNPIQRSRQTEISRLKVTKSNSLNWGLFALLKVVK